MKCLELEMDSKKEWGGEKAECIPSMNCECEELRPRLKCIGQTM